MISDTITGIKNQPLNPALAVKRPSDILIMKFTEKKEDEKYRHIDKELIQAGKVYRKEEKYTTPDGITHDTIAVKSIISWEGEKKWLLATRGISHNSRIMKEN